jgi:sugar fermentation stimulation protein A
VKLSLNLPPGLAQPPILVPLGFGGALAEAVFLARPNRFLVEAELGGALVRAHLADRGRLERTLLPGVRLLLAQRDGAGRKTAFQAVAALRPGAGGGPEEHGDTLVSLDTHLPNRLILAALHAGALAPFAEYATVRPEARIGHSRFDFLLDGPRGRCVLEVKSAGDVREGVALFPDAPTTRGLRHLEELGALARSGVRAAVLFVAQGRARGVAMNRAIDPAFAEGLGRAAASGVEVYAYACPLSRAGIALGGEIPVSGEADR